MKSGNAVLVFGMGPALVLGWRFRFGDADDVVGS